MVAHRVVGGAGVVVDLGKLRFRIISCAAARISSGMTSRSHMHWHKTLDSLVGLRKVRKVVCLSSAMDAATLFTACTFFSWAASAMFTAFSDFKVMFRELML